MNRRNFFSGALATLSALPGLGWLADVKKPDAGNLRGVNFWLLAEWYRSGPIRLDVTKLNGANKVCTTMRWEHFDGRLREVVILDYRSSTAVPLTRWSMSLPEVGRGSADELLPSMKPLESTYPRESWTYHFRDSRLIYVEVGRMGTPLGME